MKTTQEWFNELNKDYREKALKNMMDPKTEHFSLAGAISNGFVWDQTPEGKDYWNGVFREVMYGEKFNPKTPKLVEKVLKEEMPVEEVKSEVVKIPAVKLVEEKVKDTKVTDDKIVEDEKSENLYNQYKIETETQSDNSIPVEENNLFTQYKLEKNNSEPN